MSPSTKRILAKQRPNYRISLQTVFNAAWAAFIKGNHKPAYQHGCCYYTDDGCKCAVGHALPNEDAKTFRDASLGTIMTIRQELFTATEKDLLSSQLRLHDGLLDKRNAYFGKSVKWKQPRHVRRKLYIKFAEEKGLTIPS